MESGVTVFLDQDNNPISYDDFVAKVEQQHYDDINVNEYLSDPDIKSCVVELIDIYSHYTGNALTEKIREHQSKYMVDFEHFIISHKALDLLIKVMRDNEQ